VEVGGGVKFAISLEGGMCIYIWSYCYLGLALFLSTVHTVGLVQGAERKRPELGYFSVWYQRA
jgi:hypothetical protein